MPSAGWRPANHAACRKAEQGMRVVAQRVASARVEVDGQVTGSIGAGLLVLAGFEPSDADSRS
jgi:hypothetical protein